MFWLLKKMNFAAYICFGVLLLQFLKSGCLMFFSSFFDKHINYLKEMQTLSHASLICKIILNILYTHSLLVN